MAIILIVEDRPIDRKLLATILRTRGHEIVEASDGKEALDALKQISPDLVVSDILMPALDGYEFVRRMQAANLMRADLDPLRERDDFKALLDGLEKASPGR